jgi:hypothetical protein
MAGRAVDAGAVALAAVVAAGTWLYVAGLAPPFPWNVWGFNLLLGLCLAYAFAFGR